MKKFFYLAVAALSLNLTGCYNDDDVWDAINGQEQRIAALEAWQKTANENIAALQAIVNENDYITAVTPVTENGETIGYTISFMRQGNVTIYNGKDGEKGDKGDKGDTGEQGAQGAQGEKGDTPVIGVVKQDDGRWYWTLNGELLKDADGNTICASGKDGQDGSNGSSGNSAPTPQLKTGSELEAMGINKDAAGNSLQTAAVYLSVNGGSSWTRVSGRNGQNGDSFFSGAPEEGPYSWTFTLTNGAKIEVPKYNNLTLYYLSGEDWLPIEGATLSVGINEDVSIRVVTADDFNCSTNVIENTGNWIIPSPNKDGILSFHITAAGSATIRFALTTQNNQVFFYQVTVKAKEAGEVVVIEKEINAELVSALGDVLGYLPGVEINEEGNLSITQEVIDNQKELILRGNDEQKLTSLEGLDIFSNLERLDCSNNALEDIDVSVFPKLTYLNCSDNDLTTLDVSMLTGLTELHCSENELSTLDLSALKSLRVLYCENCLAQPETSRSLANGVLDMSGNPELEELYCGYNQLTELNVSENPRLTILFCNDNLLTHLDVSKNEALQRLYCQYNQLTGLSLTQNTALINLCCNGNPLNELNVSENPVLTHLYCSGNQLTQLNVSKNNSLQELNCSYNQLVSLNLTNNKKLTLLNCRYNQLTILDLSANTALKYLICGYQQTAEGRDQKLRITVAEEQIELWDNTWRNEDSNYNVIRAGSAEENPSSSGIGSFGNGGVY